MTSRAAEPGSATAGPHSSGAFAMTPALVIYDLLATRTAGEAVSHRCVWGAALDQGYGSLGELKPLGRHSIDVTPHCVHLVALKRVVAASSSMRFEPTRASATPCPPVCGVLCPASHVDHTSDAKLPSFARPLRAVPGFAEGAVHAVPALASGAPASIARCAVHLEASDPHAPPRRTSSSLLVRAGLHPFDARVLARFRQGLSFVAPQTDLSRH